VDRAVARIMLVPSALMHAYQKKDIYTFSSNEKGAQTLSLNQKSNTKLSR